MIPPVRASVIVVEYDTGHTLGACLDSLERLSARRDDLEVVVVDNDSPTPVVELVAAYPRVRLVRSPRNLGFAGGQALGLSQCSGDVIIALNPDAEVHPDWLGGMLAPFEDPAVGVVGCKIYYPDTRILQHAGGVVFGNGRTEHRGRGEVDVGQYDRLEDVPYVTGASLAVRREVIDRVGYFCAAYFPAYYEETELCLRARRAGYRVVYTPEAVVYHHEAVASGGGATPSFLSRYHTGRIRYVVRNYPVSDLLRRFLPAEIAFQANVSRAERRICFRSYVRGVLSRNAPPETPR